MTNADITLLDCEYFPCIDWYKSFLNAKNVVIEQYEFFERKTFRNRCEVTGPNGKITLSVPLEKGRNQRTIMKDVKICNKEKWQMLHWKTLCASYRRAPFFEYYEPYFENIFNKPFSYLFDLNLESLALINQLTKVDIPYVLTNEYQKPVEANTNDLRRNFSPLSFQEKNLPLYIQNFEERHGFLENLSILDMLFSCGSRTKELLTIA